MTRLRWIFALPALLIAAGAPSLAAEIRDKASLFSAQAVEKADIELKRIEREYHVPVAIETIDSLEGRKIDEVLPEHARAADAKGLYLLMSKGDHKLEVGAAKGFSKYLTRPREIAIRDAFAREFKAGDYDAGLVKGLDKIESTLSEARTEAGGSLKPSTTAPVGRKGGQAQAPAGREVPGKPSNLPGPMSLLIIIGLGLLALFIVIRVLGAIFGGGNRGYAGSQRPMGPGMGGPGYGPGYGGGGGGGGGGFMSSMFGGIGGALAGNWLYDQFSGRHHDSSMGQATNYDPTAGAGSPGETAGPDYVTPGDGGADWGGDAGGDVGGGGGDWGGGDTGGGGDWGGGGGGDWGGGGGGDDGGSW